MGRADVGSALLRLPSQGCGSSSAVDALSWASHCACVGVGTRVPAAALFSFLVTSK